MMAKHLNFILTVLAVAIEPAELLQFMFNNIKTKSERACRSVYIALSCSFTECSLLENFRKQLGLLDI